MDTIGQLPMEIVVTEKSEVKEGLAAKAGYTIRWTCELKINKKPKI